MDYSLETLYYIVIDISRDLKYRVNVLSLAETFTVSALTLKTIDTLLDRVVIITLYSSIYSVALTTIRVSYYRFKKCY